MALIYMQHPFRMSFPIWIFTFWTPQEVVTFVEQYGGKIRAEGVRLMSPESCGTSPEYTDPILNDVDALLIQIY